MMRYIRRVAPQMLGPFIALSIIFGLRTIYSIYIGTAVGGSTVNILARLAGVICLLFILSFMWAASEDWATRRKRKGL
jgi:hypothetical protein